VTPDPYPDLTAPELLDAGPVGDEPVTDERPELSEADSRLLDALSRPGPAVVTAVEDELRPTPAAQEPAPARSRRGPLTPVFQEPTD
jgi:hypothetical protein